MDRRRGTRRAALALPLVGLVLSAGLTACSGQAGHHGSAHQSTPGVPATAQPSPAPGRATATPEDPGLLLNGADKARLRSSPAKFADLIADCNKNHDYAPRPLADLNPDRHYTSSGANGPSEAHKKLQADSNAAYQQGLCFVITGDQADAATAQRIIDAWSSTLKSASTESGADEIAFDMTPMTAAASWVQGVGGWDGASYATLLRTVTVPAVAPVMAHAHNHGLWGALFTAGAASYLHDDQLLATTEKRWQVLLRQEVADDGTMTDEIQRSDTSDYTGGPTKGKKGLAYTHYAMLPASLAAKIYADHGIDSWGSAGGVLLGKAYAKAAGWTVHPETFPYHASNNGQLDGVRSASYFALLQQHFPNADGAAVLNQGNIAKDDFELLQIFG